MKRAMSLYDLPQFNFNFKGIKFLKKVHGTAVITILLASFFGFLAGAFSGSLFYLELKEYLADVPGVQKIIEKQTITEKYIPQTTQEEAIIKAVNDVSPAVVNIVISKDLPVYEQYYISPFSYQYRQKGTQKQDIGSGTGFIVSKDGMVLTNKHVVIDEEAEYTIFTNDGQKFSAKVLARDPLQDLAVLKIETEKTIDSAGFLLQKDFPTVTLGDSDKLQIGQTVIAIGNALGEFRNTVSVGVVSGLGRTITASSGDFVETIEDVIQTDAAINKGNSGGPLLNLKGEVIGINTATVLDAQSIGFAIPVNKAEKDINQVKFSGKIVYPYLGVYYTLVTSALKEKFDLPVDYGVWIGRNISGNETDEAVMTGSAAEKAGLQQDDIILEFNNEKITADNSLGKLIQKYSPGDEVTLKALRDKEEKFFQVILGERIE
ncbi:MAG: trypsin-like peptidase domain-containing protein [Candidatus Nealsonbacteria bacterium]